MKKNDSLSSKSGRENLEKGHKLRKEKIIFCLATFANWDSTSPAPFG